MRPYSTEEIQIDPGFCSSTSRIQLLYGCWVVMANVAVGLCFGFASVQVPQLLSPNSEISITRDDASWIATTLLLFCPIGCMTSGFIMDRLGRRIMLIFSQAAMFIGWLYSIFANTSDQIIIARAITGIGCGMAMSPPRIYCTEISLPNLRGVLGAFPNVAQSIGMTMQAALGIFFHWEVLCYFACFLTFINFCSFILLPESPYFTLQTKSEEDARANLAKFRGVKYNVDKEMENLLDFKDYNNLRKLTFIENIGALFTKAACKPFHLITIYVLIGQLAGNSCLIFWCIELLVAANSSYDVYVGNILLILTRVIMGIITSILLYSIGRRPLAITSAIGVTLACFTTGVFLINCPEPSVFPLICFMLYNVFASVGYYALTHLMAFELLPLQVRGILGGAFVSLHSLMMFASSKMESFMVDYLGVDYTFLTFGGFSLLGVVYIYICLPETQDLTLQEIEEYYSEIRPTLVSQRRIALTQFEAAMQSSARFKTTSSFKINDNTFSLKTSRASKAKLAARTSKAKLGARTSKAKLGARTSKAKLGAKAQFANDLQKEESSTEFDSTKSQKSTDTEYTTDSVTSRKNEKSKELKESSKDGEKTPEDKDQASLRARTSKAKLGARTSKAKLRAKAQFANDLQKEESRTEFDSTKSQKSTDTEYTTDSVTSRKNEKSKELKESSKDGEKTPEDKDQASLRARTSKAKLGARTSKAKLRAKAQFANDLQKEESRTEFDSTKSQKSTDTEYTTDSVTSRKNEKSKELKESSKDGEKTPEDKDQASTSKKNT